MLLLCSSGITIQYIVRTKRVKRSVLSWTKLLVFTINLNLICNQYKTIPIRSCLYTRKLFGPELWMEFAFGAVWGYFSKSYSRWRWRRMNSLLAIWLSFLLLFPKHTPYPLWSCFVHLMMLFPAIKHLHPQQEED